MSPSILLFLVACSPSIPNDDSSSGDTDGPGDDSGSTDDTGGPGEVYELGEPSFTADIDAAGTWTSADGYWSAAVKTVRAEVAIDASTVEIVFIEVDGDLTQAKVHPITDIEYVQQVSQAGDAFHYSVHNPSGITLKVLGFADGTALFAETQGTATLTDEVSGGTTQLTGVGIESWPAY